MDLCLLFAVVQLDIDLCTKIVAFGRSLRYMLSITDEVCKHALGSFDSDLTEIFFMLISEKIVMRFIGLKDTAFKGATSTTSSVEKELVYGYLK